MENFRTLTFFISSTFSDMQSERDYLNHTVFPLISEELRKKSIFLRIIDLRWGVNTLDEKNNSLSELENGVEDKILRVCFNEIERSKPFFIGLLGEKYGWIPPKEKVTSLKSKYKIKEGDSITSMEIDYAFFQNPEDFHFIFCERDSSSYQNMTEEHLKNYDENYAVVNKEESRERAEKLKTLKTKIRRKLTEHKKENNYIQYTASWDGNKFCELTEFGENLRKAILQEVNQYLSDEDDYTTLPWEKKELLLQNEFIYEHLKVISVRNEIHEQLRDKLFNSNEGTVLIGESGQGKSSIYASLVNDLKQNYSQQSLVLYHSAGISHYSNKISYMLKRWVYEMAEYVGETNPELNTTEEYLLYFKHFLKKVPTDIQVILLIDSLDSFVQDEYVQYLTFFPRYEFRKLSLLCTSLPGYEKRAATYNQKIKTYRLPVLEEKEANNIILSFFNYYRKELHQDVLNSLLSKRKGDNLAYESPLWLSLALQILLNVNEDDFQKIKQIRNVQEEEKIKIFLCNLVDEMPADEYNLFIYFLHRVNPIYNGLPEKVYTFLACSFDGLSEEQLQELSGEKWNPVSFALFYNFFRSLFVEQGYEKKWKITHSKFKHSPAKNNDYKETYSVLCDYFLDKVKTSPLEISDNILYYLCCDERYSDTNQYLLSFDIENQTDKKRILGECRQLIEKVGVEKFINFFDRVFDSQNREKKAGFFVRKAKEYSLLQKERNIIEALGKDLAYIGEYKTTMQLLNYLLDKIKKSKILGDLKMTLYIIVVSQLVDVIKSSGTKEEKNAICQEIIAYIKIRGLISLILVPLSKQYYKWDLFKLNT